jgi:hypothetical protein
MEKPPLNATGGNSEGFVLSWLPMAQWHTFFGAADDRHRKGNRRGDDLLVAGVTWLSWDHPAQPDWASRGRRSAFQEARTLVLALDCRRAYQWHAFYGAPPKFPRHRQRPWWLYLAAPVTAWNGRQQRCQYHLPCTSQREAQMPWSSTGQRSAAWYLLRSTPNRSSRTRPDVSSTRLGCISALGAAPGWGIRMARVEPTPAAASRRQRLS